MFASLLPKGPELSRVLSQSLYVIVVNFRDATISPETNGSGIYAEADLLVPFGLPERAVAEDVTALVEDPEFQALLEAAREYSTTRGGMYWYTLREVGRVVDENVRSYQDAERFLSGFSGQRCADRLRTRIGNDESIEDVATSAVRNAAARGVPIQWQDMLDALTRLLGEFPPLELGRVRASGITAQA